jgi:3-methyladenine DNA glycosylase Tag
MTCEADGELRAMDIGRSIATPKIIRNRTKTRSEVREARDTHLSDRR